MKHVLKIFISIAGFAAAHASAQQLTLDEAVRRALDRSSERERAHLAAVVANERYLESQSKFRWEFRPRLGLLAFSNPAVLASNIGLGMLLGRAQPPAWARQSARLDSLAAEVALQRAVVTARLEATRQYFQVLMRQQARDELIRAVQHYRSSQAVRDERTRSTRVTALERVVWETRLVALETQVEEAETSVREAASTLARTVGMNKTSDVLQVADVDGTEPDADIPSTAIFREVALKQHDRENGLTQKIEAEKKRLVGKSGFGLTPVSLGYAHVSDHAGSKLPVGQGGFLLGGHTGTIDLGVKVSLRRTGEQEALAYLAAARLKSIELELLAIGDLFHSELDALRLLAISSRRKAELAARRLKLSNEALRLLFVREQTGLESVESLLNAEVELLRSRTHLLQAEAESRTRWRHLIAASELLDENGRSKMQLGQAMNPAGDGDDAGADR
jgi:hypothetical protein